ncbi:hypothetical protein F5B20DRAFT_539734 [Whalleya microplaca]|nr:hypothetical protein F5B20DRAFT_539734 [Whalleya microplaca]
MAYASKFSSAANPSNTDYKSLYNFFYNHDPVIDSERYFRHRDDLVNLMPRGDTAGVDRLFAEWLLDSPNKVIKWLFQDRNKSGQDAFMIIHSERKVMFARAILLGVPLVSLLVCPLYPLYRLNQGEMTECTLIKIMFIQIGFTGIFTICLNFLTRPRRHELFACAITYMGVLLVFMNQTILPGSQQRP